MGSKNSAKNLHSQELVLPDPGSAGTITVERNPCFVPLVSAAAETRTLARPTKEGIFVTLVHKTDGGDITLTVTGGYNEDGDTTFTFSDGGQFAVFVSAYDGTDFYWRKISDYTTGSTTPTELGFLNGVTAGTAAASKALVLDASKRAGTVTELAVTTPIVGQGTPTAETGVATITIADILTGIVTLSQSTGATVALTLDTGTAMDTGKPSSLGTDQAIDWFLINLSAAAADTGTLTAASGHTIVGNPIVQAAHSSTGGIYGNSAHFRSRRTAANTWVTYRVA